MGKIRAEYIWIDGTEPTPLLRSKTKVMDEGDTPPEWGFDGSSTNQATGDRSDCILRPVFTCPDPLRADGDILVLCDVYSADGSVHPSNTRAACAAAETKHKAQEAWYGMEQEYTLMKNGRPYGFPEGGYPGPQGPYYCGTGASNVMGRELIEEHLEACIMAGLKISGINAEVMPGQWEFQIGPAGPTEVGDHMYIARYLLCRMAESYGVDASFEAKPAKGDWNGAGCHSNFSTKAMREPGGWDVIIAACEKLGQPEKIKLHIANYGHDIESRLTGKHETCSYKEFKYGVSDRGASIRIPLATKLQGYGYFEDRRPNANMDPYTVARLLLETTCD
ncbi:MAG: glutamine synthetase beta-grasp domain-containing protein [Sandaracinaceae bacterium]|jgi:glutamine synthetase|nr:glutamine synthetase beta-grasp domain-containing protein [Sandaracinaceae bacterium]MBK6807574.1 glutamine synthetase beta-grasp domain-containing protein [Sandaracinaceae bacterium]MBK7152384.1 glutamine synthetase beta-grasp domain-containing protein [Sandaracinaceae bacterium]